MDQAKMEAWRNSSHVAHRNKICRRTGPYLFVWARWPDGSVSSVCIEDIVKEMQLMAGKVLSSFLFLQIPKVYNLFRAIVEGQNVSMDLSSMKLDPPIGARQKVRCSLLVI
jgi:hypothetical protein